MATAERQGNRRREGESYWSAQTHGRIISVNGHDFFAPTDLMRLVSEYRSPRKVCERTGLSFHRWQSWERKYANTQPWVLDYLLRVEKKSVPKGHIVHQVSQQKFRKRPPKNHECYTTEEQEAFRRNATNEAAIEHAKRDLAAGKAPSWLRDEKRKTSGATRKMLESKETRLIARTIVYALKLYMQHDWYRPWQAGARTPAETVTILQPAEVARLETLLDVRPTLKLVGSQIGTWDDWRKGLPGDRISDFIHWMLGGPEPKRWLIIGSDVERLQAEARTAAIERAAKCPGQYARWTDELQKRALQAAIEDARSPGPSSLENDPRWREYADALDVADDDGRRRTTIASRAKTIIAMKRFGRHAAPKAIRQRAGWTEGEWTHLLSKASEVGVTKDLERHVYNEHETTKGQRFAKSGIIADKLFRASQAMEQFRVVHQKAYVSTKASTLAKLPCFDAFAVAWTAPQEWHRKRLTDVPVAGNVGTNTATPVANPLYRPIEKALYGLSEIESNIVEAVDVNCLLGDEIAKKSGYAYNSYFRTKLRELVVRGILQKGDRGVGYRRPEAPDTRVR